MLCHSIYLQVVKVHLFNLRLPMNRYTFVLPSEIKNAFACSPSAQMPLLKDISSIRIFCKDILRRPVLRVKKMTKFKKNTHLSLSPPLSLSLSLLVDLSMHFDFPEMMCMYQSLSLSLSIYICKNGLDPDQTRMEFKKECLVNLKICACDSVVQKPMRTIKWIFSISQ